MLSAWVWWMVCAAIMGVVEFLFQSAFGWVCISVGLVVDLCCRHGWLIFVAVGLGVDLYCRSRC